MTLKIEVRPIVVLIVLSTLFRLFLASQLELGNDEVYYWTYALFPDFSHFDHPPMVGLLAQLFTLNLHLKDDFFLRLGSICLSAGSTWIIYIIGRRITNERTGWCAALLFTGSVYCSIISGFSLTPDAPLVFFWLLAINSALKFLPQSPVTIQGRMQAILFGIFTGLAMLSKYQGAFLWIGVLVYLLLYNWRWLKEPSLYLSVLLSFIVFSPVLYWNFMNDFISFAFHSSRITPSFGMKPMYFLREIGGEIAYNNPINYALIVMALVAMARGKFFIRQDYARILLAMAIPLWLTFTGFSLFRATLPHWTGPAFVPLILIAASFCAQGGKSFDVGINSSVVLLAVALIFALYMINYSTFRLGDKTESRTLGSGDFTMDMFGWDQIENGFKTISTRTEQAGIMPERADMISYRWFPGAHLDFYVARPSQRNLFLLRQIDETHKYFWINDYRGGLKEHASYYSVAVSNDFRNPKEIFRNSFQTINLIDSVAVKRGGQTVKFAFIYLLKNYKGTSNSKANP